MPVQTRVAKGFKALLDAGISIGPPQNKISDRELTLEEYDRYQAEAGKRGYAALSELVDRNAS